MKPQDLAQGETFAQYLRCCRLHRGMSQAEVTRLTGISGPYLVALEKGHRGVPTLKLVKRLELAYGLEPLTLCAVAWREV